LSVESGMTEESSNKSSWLEKIFLKANPVDINFSDVDLEQERPVKSGQISPERQATYEVRFC
jgi:hypothetical protein